MLESCGTQAENHWVKAVMANLRFGAPNDPFSRIYRPKLIFEDPASNWCYIQLPVTYNAMIMS